MNTTTLPYGNNCCQCTATLLTMYVCRNTYYLIGTAGLMFTAVWQLWAEAKPAHCKWISKEEKEFLEATVSPNH